MILPNSSLMHVSNKQICESFKFRQSCFCVFVCLLCHLSFCVCFVCFCFFHSVVWACLCAYFVIFLSFCVCFVSFCFVSDSLLPPYSHCFSHGSQQGPRPHNCTILKHIEGLEREPIILRYTIYTTVITLKQC